MRIGRSLASAAAAVSLMVAPVAAQAAVADRTATAVEGEELASPVLLALGFLIAFGVAAILIADSDDPDDNPVSP